MANSRLPARFAIFLGVFITVFASCAFTSDPLPQTGPNSGAENVSGYVRDESGTPIARAEIYISDADYKPLIKTITDQFGHYQVQLPPSATYHLYTGVLSQKNKYNFAYVPQTRSVTLKAGSPANIDFKLRPGATIVFYAYDNDGNLIRNKRFRELTNANAFATNLNNIPKYGSFTAIHDAFSNWQWDQAIPAFVVMPQALYKFQISWEVPDFGKVLLSIDNNCNGYLCNLQADKIELNFNYEAAKSKMTLLRRDYEKLQKQINTIPHDIVELFTKAQAHLRNAEAILNKQANPNMKTVVNELNLCLTMAFRAHEKVNLEQAKCDIEQNRKGSIRVQVTDAGGNPLPGSKIRYKQISNDFLFGANPLAEDGSYDEKYVSLMKEAGINHTSITSRWGRLEPLQGQFDWNNIDSFQNLQRQIDDGFDVTGTLSLWLYREKSVGLDFCPAYLDNMDFPQLKDAVYNYIHTMAKRYRGNINTWEINEMNLPWANALNLTIDQRAELVGVFHKAVSDANPDAQVLVNSSALPFEYNLSDFYVFDNVATPFFIDLLKTRQIPFDIIGLEFYYAGVTRGNIPLVNLDMGLISDLLDQYNEYNIPIYIEELSAPSSQVAGSAWWHSTWDEERQAEYVKNFYTIAFSKPMVKAINWSWGVTDRESYILSGGLIDAGMKPKKAYYALQQLISSWKSSGEGITDNNGNITIRGFGGEYEIECTGIGGKSSRTRMHIYEQKQETTGIVLK